MYRFVVFMHDFLCWKAVVGRLVFFKYSRVSTLRNPTDTNFPIKKGNIYGKIYISQTFNSTIRFDDCVCCPFLYVQTYAKLV